MTSTPMETWVFQNLQETPNWKVSSSNSKKHGENKMDEMYVGNAGGPFCMVIFAIHGGSSVEVEQVIGPFQTHSALMDYVFGKNTVLRGYAERVLSGTNIPFTINDREYVISDLNAPYTEQVQNLNRPTEQRIKDIHDKTEMKRRK